MNLVVPVCSLEGAHDGCPELGLIVKITPQLFRQVSNAVLLLRRHDRGREETVQVQGVKDCGVCSWGSTT